MMRARLRSAGTLLLSTALLAQTLGGSEARAGGRMDCREAGVFSAATVNALILPYRYEMRGGFDRHRAGSRLAALVQQETLLAMLKYRSVGATELVNDSPQCNAEAVLGRIMREGQNTLRPGAGVVIVWGRIYEHEAQIFVQTYLRFLRRDVQEAIAIELPAGESSKLRLEAALPAQGAAMQPRRLTQADLREIEERLAATLVLHDEPNDGARRKRLDSRTEEALTYGVVAAAGDWMQIRSYVSNETGWVRARMDTEAWALRRLLPELGYLEGVIAYLSLRTQPQQDPRRVYDWMDRAFAGFGAAVGKDAAPEAMGLAQSMKGMVLWTQPAPLGDRAAAARLFGEALELLPSSSRARTLAAVTAPFRSGRPIVDKQALAELDRGLLGAVAVESRDVLALANLQRTYELARAIPELSPYGGAELETRLAAVRSARLR